MSNFQHLPRKLTLRAHGHQVVLFKKANESMEHVLMKALIWALYLPKYPDAGIEPTIGDRYKPDVVMLNDHREPLFWGEAGHVSPEKIRSLTRRFRRTHFAIGKWTHSLTPHEQVIQKAMTGVKREAPLDLLAFPHQSAELFVDNGHISIDHSQINWVRITPHL